MPAECATGASICMTSRLMFRVCVVRSPGTSSLVGATACWTPCGVPTCAAGYSCVGTVCTQCPAGMFAIIIFARGSLTRPVFTQTMFRRQVCVCGATDDVRFLHHSFYQCQCRCHTVYALSANDAATLLRLSSHFVLSRQAPTARIRPVRAPTSSGAATKLCSTVTLLYSLSLCPRRQARPMCP